MRIPSEKLSNKFPKTSAEPPIFKPRPPHRPIPDETWGENIERNTGRALNDQAQLCPEAKEKAREEDFFNPFAAWEA